MHEFSLATNVLEIVSEAVQKAGKEKVISITLEIGSLAGIEKEALISALDCMSEPLTADTKFEIVDIPGIAYCINCKKEYPTDTLYSLCPICQGYEKQIISGKEFNVVKIEAE